MHHPREKATKRDGTMKRFIAVDINMYRLLLSSSWSMQKSWTHLAPRPALCHHDLQRKFLSSRRNYRTTTKSLQNREIHKLEELIQTHYNSIGQKSSLREMICQGLVAVGKPSLDSDEYDDDDDDDDNDDDNDNDDKKLRKKHSLSIEDLAPLDGFHSRGKEGTMDLCRMAAGTIRPTDHVLDVGCGLGGTARYLAHHYGVTVQGMDLTSEYVTVGNELTQKVGLSDKVTLRQASALDLPFPDESFDWVWTEHVQMNIADKETFYREIFRVLQKDGKLLFHEVLRGSESSSQDEEPEYPCPWAETKAMSKLSTEMQLGSIMKAAGFTICTWEDQTDKTVAFFRSSLKKIAERGGLPPLGVHLLMGETAIAKLENHLKNNESGRTKVVMGVLKKTR